MDLKNVIGLKIRGARHDKGWTQEQLAESIEKAVETVSNIERGHSHTSIETLVRIAEALEIRVASLFDDIEDHIQLHSCAHVQHLEQLKQLISELSAKELRVILDTASSLIRNRPDGSG